jgi:hypothetical protein
MVVFFLCADPKPDDEIAVLLCHRAIMISNSDRPHVADKRFDLKRWMERIALPNAKLISSEALNVGR